MCQASQTLGCSRKRRVQALQTITPGCDAVAGKPRSYPSPMSGSPKTQNHSASRHLARATYRYQQELARDTQRQREEMVFPVSCQRGHSIDSPPNPTTSRAVFWDKTIKRGDCHIPRPTEHRPDVGGDHRIVWQETGWSCL